MSLLQQTEDRGYPAEYLLSRIRGRRSRLIKEWRQLLFEASPRDYVSSSHYRGFISARSPQDLWKDLIREHRWVYSQMNKALRTAFEFYFFYAEFRTLFICLRHLNDKSPGSCRDLLDLSLLSDVLKEILSRKTDERSAVEEMEKVFVSFSPEFHGMSDIVEAQGPRGVEQFLVSTYLTEVMRRPLNPVIRAFFARLIDSRNIMRLYKCLSFGQKQSFSFLPGGTIARPRFQELLDREDTLGIYLLIREFFRIKIENPEPTKVETALYAGITRFLKEKGKEPLGTALILDYLWKCSLEVMNLSILISGRDLERETVEAELVQ